MYATKEYNGEGFLSDSSTLHSSTSIDPYKRSEKCFDCNFQTSLLPSKSKHSTKKRSRSNSKLQPKYKVRRRSSLVQCLEKQPLNKRKSKLSNLKFFSFPRQHDCNKSQTPLGSESPTCGNEEKSDTSARSSLGNQVQFVYPAMTTQTLKNPFLEHDTFPFKATPSGHYKLSKSQVVYESKNLSIVAADPDSAVVQVKDSNKEMETEPVKRAEQENWDTTCLYMTVGAGGKMAFGSEYSDTISESDGGYMNRNSPNKPSEISLAKMGYVVDNCLDWKNYSFPNKSELQKLLLHNVLNKINTDVQVKIGNSVSHCHKIVLQCYCTNIVLKSGSIMELPETEVSKEVFSQIYQWMLHLGTDSFKLLRRDNILDIYKAANYLKIKELEDQCWAFIDSVDVFFEDRAFLLYLAARKYKNRTVMELMIPRVQRFFLTLVSSKEFVEFSCEEVCTFLRSNYICIHCEMEVFMAGVRWLDHDWTRREQHAVEVMSCVRFGFINPEVLITVRRDPKSPEFLRVANIPRISQMIDDGIALTVLKTNLANESEEDFQKNLMSFGLTIPIPRNWAGTNKVNTVAQVLKYLKYSEFLQELHNYRSNQRLDVKLSKIKLKLESVNDGDFLSSAVLPPATHQKIKKMAGGSALIRCLPQLEPKEIDLLKKMICQEESLVEDKGKKMKSKLYSMAEEEYKQGPTQKYKEANKPPVKVRRPTPSVLDQDEAARKIQRYYRQYSRTKIRKVQSKEVLDGHWLNKNIRAMSNPSLPVYLMKADVMKRVNDENSESLLPSTDSLLVFGGVNPFQDINSCNSGSQIYQYVSSSNSWRVFGEMPEPRHFHSVIFFRGRIYVAGGKHPAKETSSPGAISPKVWKFDPNCKRWSQIRDMKYPRRSFGFVACNDSLFVLGGSDDQERILSNVERYDAEAEKWMEVQPMHEPRAGLAASEFNNHIWVAGGLINNSHIATKSVEYYDHQHNMWTLVSSLRYTLAYSVMVPAESCLFLVGGAIGLEKSTLSGSGRQVDVWDPVSQDWALATMMCKPRHAHAAVCLRSDTLQSAYLVVLGGISTKHTSVLDRVDCWSERDNQWISGIAKLPRPLAGHVALALPSHILG